MKCTWSLNNFINSSLSAIIVVITYNYLTAKNLNYYISTLKSSIIPID